MIIQTRRTWVSHPSWDEQSQRWEAYVPEMTEFMPVEGHYTEENAVAAFVLRNKEALGIQVQRVLPDVEVRAPDPVEAWDEEGSE